MPRDTVEIAGVEYELLESRWKGRDNYLKLRAPDGSIVHKAVRGAVAESMSFGTVGGKGSPLGGFVLDLNR